LAHASKSPIPKSRISKPQVKNFYTLSFDDMQYVLAKDASILKKPEQFNQKYLEIANNVSVTNGREAFMIPMILPPVHGVQGFPTHIKLGSDSMTFIPLVKEAIEKNDLSYLGETIIPKSPKAINDMESVIAQEENKGLPDFSMLILQVPNEMMIGNDSRHNKFLLEGTYITILPQNFPPMQMSTQTNDNIRVYRGFANKQKPLS
jgi:hypothetical protein